uniref:Tf2-1-like SH3-like domain-containing protein n=1 Tax=Nicotiana tabacum TaxID=4097 RepID=A0A1S3ZU11_TOBAC|nr:PREDICTED: uncharacterized protein LOC107790450 [Nicotiana tabacum]
MAGEKVLLRVPPMKGAMWLGKKGKLSPRFIGPFEILKTVGEVVYRLELPPSLVGVHLLFHISMLRKYHEDKLYVLDFNTVQLDETQTYEEKPVVILDLQVRTIASDCSAAKSPENSQHGNAGDGFPSRAGTREVKQQRVGSRPLHRKDA